MITAIVVKLMRGRIPNKWPSNLNPFVLSFFFVLITISLTVDICLAAIMWQIAF